MNTTINTNTITESTTLAELIAILGSVTKAEKTPTSKALREEAGEPIAADDRCQVYANGYGVYDNGSGRTVFWIPSCVAFTYHFNPMKESEKGGEIKETFDLPEGFLESQPWPIALTLIGDHRIENLSMQRKGDRKQSKSLIRGNNEEGDAMDDMEEREDSLAKEYTWRDEQIGEDPETIYIRKETRQEMLEGMTEKQREVFILYFKEGYTQREIAGLIGISKQSVNERLEGAVKKVKKICKNIEGYPDKPLLPRLYMRGLGILLKI